MAGFMQVKMACVKGIELPATDFNFINPCLSRGRLKEINGWF